MVDAFVISIFCLLVFSLPLRAEGLATSFVDVAVLDVPVGAERLVQDRAGKGMTLWNKGSAALEVDIEPRVPTAAELRGGASAIPDPAWVQIRPSQMMIPAGGEVSCEVVIAVPRQRRWRRKLYQVMIWSRGRPADATGLSVGMGLLSRLRFRTASSLAPTEN